MHEAIIRILLVEDNAADARLVHELLREGDPKAYELQHVDRLADAVAHVGTRPTDVVLLDLGLPDSTGLPTVQTLLEASEDVAVVVLTGHWDEALASEAVRSGAQEYLVKGDINARALTRVIRYALERKQRENERHRSEQELLLLHRLALALGEAVDLTSALSLVIREACRATGWVTGEAWLPTRDGAHLQRGPVHDESGALGRFHAVSERVTFTRDDGLPGTAWHTGRPIWVPDVTRHPSFRRAELARDVGIRTAMMIPVLARDEVAAVLAFYHTEVREQDRRLLHVIATAAAQLGTLVQRRQTEQALRQSETRLRRLMDTAYEGIWVLDAADRTEYVNSRLADMLGYTVAEMLGRQFHEFLDEPSGPEAECRLQRRRRGESEMSETRFRRKDGSLLWTLTSASPIRQEDGQLSGSLVMLNDITARKEAEEAESLLSAAGDVLASSLDLQETLSGIADLLVPQLADWCAIRVRQGKAESAFLEVRADTPSKEAEIRRRVTEADTRSADGSVSADGAPSTHALAIPLTAHGVDFGRITLGRAETNNSFADAERRLIDELGRRAAIAIENARLYEQANRAWRARDEVLGFVAHDLRNPLSAISLTAGLLLSTPLTEEKRALRLEGILRSVDQMNRLIQDLLDVTRIESGRLRVEAEPVVVAPLLSDVREMFEGKAAERGLDLHVEADESLPDVWADRQRILQVLSNLLGNAVKFTPAGGSISVRAGMQHGQVRFSVSDTGIGISAEQLPHLFDRFWQANSAGRGGAGLGLAIAKGLVEANAGTLSVESAPGLGSTFSFTLRPAGTGQTAIAGAAAESQDAAKQVSC